MNSKKSNINKYTNNIGIEKIYNARINALKILQNRGYDVPKSSFNFDKSYLSIAYDKFNSQKDHSNSLDYKLFNKECMAKISWITDKKYYPIVIQEFQNDLKFFRNKILSTENSVPSYNDNLIIILLDNNHLIPKDYFIEGKNIENEFISFFSYLQLQVNIIDHYLVPNHKYIDTISKKKLFKKYNINIDNIPVIIRFADMENNLCGDPIARYYGLKQNDILEITKNDGLYINYRIVKDQSNNLLTINNFYNEINLQKIDITSDLGETYYKSYLNNSSYFGVNFKKIKNILYTSIVNQDINSLEYILLEINSFYLLLFHLNKISNKNKWSNYDYKIIKKNIENNKIPNVNKNEWLKNLINFIKFQTLYKINYYIKKIFINFYLNIYLAEHINKCCLEIDNILTNFSKIDDYYKVIRKLCIPFCQKENVQINVIQFIRHIFCLPMYPYEINDISLKQDQLISLSQQLDSTNLNQLLESIAKINERPIDYNDLELKYKTSDYANISFIFDIDNHKIKENLILIYEFLSKPIYIDNYTGVNIAFLYLKNIFQDINFNNSFNFNFIIDSIYRIIMCILKVNLDKYKDIINIINHSKKWNEIKYLKYSKLFTIIYNHFILVSYRDNNVVYDIINKQIDTTLLSEIPTLEKNERHDFINTIDKVSDEFKFDKIKVTNVIEIFNDDKINNLLDILNSKK